MQRCKTLATLQGKTLAMLQSNAFVILQDIFATLLGNLFARLQDNVWARCVASEVAETVYQLRCVEHVVVEKKLASYHYYDSLIFPNFGFVSE